MQVQARERLTGSPLTRSLTLNDFCLGGIPQAAQKASGHLYTLLQAAYKLRRSKTESSIKRFSPTALGGGVFTLSAAECSRLT